MSKTITLPVSWLALGTAAAILVAAKTLGAPISWHLALLPVWMLIGVVAIVLAAITIVATLALVAFIWG